MLETYCARAWEAALGTPFEPSLAADDALEAFVWHGRRFHAGDKAIELAQAELLRRADAAEARRIAEARSWPPVWVGW